MVIYIIFEYLANYITVEDLRLVFRREGKNLSNEEITEMIQESNPEHHTKISFDEFCEMMEPKRPHLEEKDRDGH